MLLEKQRKDLMQKLEWLNLSIIKRY
jgi:hypothetical protein